MLVSWVSNLLSILKQRRSLAGQNNIYESWLKHKSILVKSDTPISLIKNNNFQIKHKYFNSRNKTNNSHPTWATAHPNSSGFWFAQAATNKPPFEPPLIASLCDVIVNKNVIRWQLLSCMYNVIMNEHLQGCHNN